jgi:hypothetical protein
MLIPEPIDFRNLLLPRYSLSYLLKSLELEAKMARAMVNRFYHNLPDSNKREFKKRFFHDFKSAFFELLNHQIFFNLNFQIEEHPALIHSKKKPDFVLTQDTLQVYLECKEFRAEKEAIDFKLIDQTILNRLNKLKSKYYRFVIKRLKILDAILPDLSCFYEEIEIKMQDYPNLHLNYNPPFPLFYHEYISDKIMIKIEFYLKENWAYEMEETHLISAYINHPILEIDIKSLKSGLIKKLVRYKIKDTPLIISLNITSASFCTPIIFEDLFYGTTLHKIHQINSDRIPYRTADGLFTKPTNNLSSIAGVMVFFDANPFNVEYADYCFYNNPSYSGSFNISENLSQANFVNGAIEYKNQKSLKQLIL